jgi:hypothetical protein
MTTEAALKMSIRDCEQWARYADQIGDHSTARIWLGYAEAQREKLHDLRELRGAVVILEGLLLALSVLMWVTS